MPRFQHKFVFPDSKKQNLMARNRISAWEIFLSAFLLFFFFEIDGGFLFSSLAKRSNFPGAALSCRFCSLYWYIFIVTSWIKTKPVSMSLKTSKVDVTICVSFRPSLDQLNFLENEKTQEKKTTKLNTEQKCFPLCTKLRALHLLFCQNKRFFSCVSLSPIRKRLLNFIC